MYNVIIIGMGCVGLSTCYYLSKTDMDVLGLEQYNVLNNHGSSHGSSRIFRLAYHEGEKYIPMLYDAINNWKKLEEYSSEKLFYNTGSLVMGPKNAQKFKYSKESCEKFNLDYKIYDDISNVYPAWNLPDNYKTLFQKQGGLINNKECMKTQLKQSIKNGININTHERVLSWRKYKNKIIVTTNKNKYYTDKIVISSGPWAKNNSKLKNILSIEKHVYGKFKMKNENLFNTDNFPVWILDTGTKKYYGLPSYKNNGTKIGETTNKKIISRMKEYNNNASSEETKNLINFYTNYTNSQVEKIKHIKTCPLTNTPDHDFIIDEIEDNVFVGVGLSGHGFKLSNIIGKILSNMCEEKQIEYNISPFSINRFN